mgnify:FL=1
MIFHSLMLLSVVSGPLGVIRGAQTASGGDPCLLIGFLILGLIIYAVIKKNS